MFDFRWIGHCSIIETEPHAGAQIATLHDAENALESLEMLKDALEEFIKIKGD